MESLQFLLNVILYCISDSFFKYQILIRIFQCKVNIWAEEETTTGGTESRFRFLKFYKIWIWSDRTDLLWRQFWFSPGPLCYPRESEFCRLCSPPASPRPGWDWSCQWHWRWPEYSQELALSSGLCWVLCPQISAQSPHPPAWCRHWGDLGSRIINRKQYYYHHLR